MYTHQKNGFSLIEIMIAVGLSGFVMIGSSFLINSTFQVQKNEDQMFWLEERRGEILTAIQNDENWTKLAGLNTQMACATNPTGCMAFSSPQPLILKINPILTLMGTNPALGFNKKGDVCYQFNAVSGHSDCVIGVQLNWQAICLDTSCIKPQFKIDITFQYKASGQNLQKNLKPFNLTLYSNSKIQNLYDVCLSMGGTLVGLNCQIPALTSACDPSNTSGTGATFALGFDATGAVICGKPAVSSCSATEFLTGFNADGSSICTAGCVAGPPTSPVNCVGSFGACSAVGCGNSGKRTYVISTPASGGGAPCAYSAGTQVNCTNPACFSSCTPAPCFVAGTPVLMANGKYKAIEKIKAGDRVVSFDEHKKTQRIDKVLYPTAHKKQWQRLHHFELIDGTKFTSNAIHPFYIFEKDYWFEAQEISSMLKQGQQLSMLSIKNQSILIKSIQVEHKEVPVYNIEVHGLTNYDAKYGKWGNGHNYYIKGILTHNKLGANSCDPSDPSCEICPPNSTQVGGICITCPSGKVYNSGMCCVSAGPLIEIEP